MALGKYLPSTSMGIPNITRILIPLTPDTLVVSGCHSKRDYPVVGPPRHRLRGVWSECFSLSETPEKLCFSGGPVVWVEG